MKNLFEQSRSHWVRYDRYELKTDADGKRYITPGKNAKPDIYNPLKEAPGIVLDALNVQNVTLVHARAEDGARMKEHRECYDVAVARAVAPLPVLAEYLLPYVKVGGKAVCWKGPAVQDELGAGKKAAFLLGGKLAEPIPVAIPGQEWQHLLLPIAKQTKTARQYPRKAGTPGKSPLGQTDKA